MCCGRTIFVTDLSNKFGWGGGDGELHRIIKSMGSQFKASISRCQNQELGNGHSLSYPEVKPHASPVFWNTP